MQDPSTNWTASGTHVAGTGTNADPIAKRSGVSNFSDFTLAGGASENPLPIELLAFNANRINDGVSLNWSTASEYNNDFFTVERSQQSTVVPIVIGSQQSATKWEVIGKVKSKAAGGNSSNKLNYELVDKLLTINNLPLTIFYYRLKQTDFDGQFKYSGIVSIPFKPSEGSGLAFSVFPNPSRPGELMADLSCCAGKEVIIIVYDAFGNEVFSKVILTENNRGTNSAIDPNGKLKPGIYFISAASDNNVYRQRIVISQ